MSFIDDLKRWANGDDEEEETLEEFTPARSARREREEEDKTSTVTDFRRSANNKVVNINATTQLSVVLVKPDKYENAPEIADHLRERRTVVINLEQTNKDVAKRLIDFLSGVAYANSGSIQRVAGRAYIITPNNVPINGELLDEIEGGAKQ